MIIHKLTNRRSNSEFVVSMCPGDGGGRLKRTATTENLWGPC